MPPPSANLVHAPSQAHHADSVPAAAPPQHQTPKQQTPASQKQYKTKPHPPTKADLLLSPAHIVAAKPLSALSDGEVRGLVALIRGRIGVVDLNLVARGREGDGGFWGRLRNGKLRREGEGDGGGEQGTWLKVGMWEYGLVREMDAGGRVMARCGEGGGSRSRGFGGEWVAATLFVLIGVGLVLRLVRLRWNRGQGRFGGV